MYSQRCIHWQVCCEPSIRTFGEEDVDGPPGSAPPEPQTVEEGGGDDSSILEDIAEGAVELIYGVFFGMGEMVVDQVNFVGESLGLGRVCRPFETGEILDYMGFDGNSWCSQIGRRSGQGTVVVAEMFLGGQFVGWLGSSGPATGEALVTVSRWGRPGLQAGDWIMKGGATRWDYFWSAKWQWAWVYGGNVPATFASGVEYSVLAQHVSKAPGVLGFLKGLVGQRIYTPR